MPRIFISYRRSDGLKDASRLAEDLAEVFGPAQLFFDLEHMQGGQSWRAQIQEAIKDRPVVVVMLITPAYFNEQRDGRPRIDEPNDAVRLELLQALAAEAVLLPVLVDQAQPPEAKQLPNRLRHIAGLHMRELRSRHWRQDVPPLIEDLIRNGLQPLDPDWAHRYGLLGGTQTARAGRWPRPLGAGLLLTALLGGAWLGWDGWQDQQAQRHLRDGLAAYTSATPNLMLARNEYLLAIEADPDLGAAHYYLALIYGSTRQPQEAERHLRLALRHPAGLDGPLQQDIEQRLSELDRQQELARRNPEPVPIEPAPVRVATGIAVRNGVLVQTGPDGRQRLVRAVPASAALTGRVLDLIGRVPLPDERRSSLGLQIEQSFGADPAARQRASLNLLTTPSLSADAAPLALARSLQELPAQADSTAVRAGVVTTMRLLQNASPVTLQASRAEIERLLQAIEALPVLTRIQGGAVTLQQRLQDSRAAGRPQVELQLAHEGQRSFATELAGRLSAAGYQVEPLRISTSAPEQSSVIALGSSSQPLARWLRKALEDAGAEGSRIEVQRQDGPPQDRYTIRLARALCDPAAACRH